MPGEQNTDELIAYWLVPAEPARAYFSKIIRDLGGRYDAPIFEPHLTIFAAPPRASTPAATILREALAEAQPIRLSLRRIASSDAFTKSVFVEFETTRPLGNMMEAFRHALPFAGDYELNPHLSLIYKTMPLAQKELIANAVFSLPAEVTFDCAKAILCRVPIQSRTDVESWRTLAVQPLPARNDSR